MERALYYPYFHVRETRWLKTAALYWPGLAHVLPPDYHAAAVGRAHPDVRQLVDELGFFTSLNPAPVIATAGQRFVDLSQRHAPALRAHFFGSDVAMPTEWARSLRTDAGVTAEGNRGRTPVVRGSDRIPVAAIHHRMVSPDALEALTESGLAAPFRGSRADRSDWVSMPAALVSLFSSVVAEELATRNRISLTTDQAQAFRDTTDASTDQLAALLLGAAPHPRQGNAATGTADGAADSVLDVIRLLTVRLAVPLDLDRIPMKKIIEVRRNHREEFAAYYAAVEQTAADLRERITPQTDPALVEAYVNDEVTARFKDPQTRLKKHLRGAGLDAGLASLAVQVPVHIAAPAALVAGAGAAAESAVAVAGFGVAALGWFVANRRRRDAVTDTAPVASYLLQVDSNLNARWLLTRTARRAARLTGTA